MAQRAGHDRLGPRQEADIAGLELRSATTLLLISNAVDGEADDHHTAAVSIDMAGSDINADRAADRVVQQPSPRGHSEALRRKALARVRSRHIAKLGQGSASPEVEGPFGLHVMRRFDETRNDCDTGHVSGSPVPGETRRGYKRAYDSKLSELTTPNARYESHCERSPAMNTTAAIRCGDRIPTTFRVSQSANASPPRMTGRVISALVRGRRDSQASERFCGPDLNGGRQAYG